MNAVATVITITKSAGLAIRPSKTVLYAAVLTACISAQSSHAVNEPTAYPVPIAIKQSVGDAHLVGKGMLRVFGFRVYEARLFASPSWSIKEGWDKQSFALELSYLRSVSGKAISQSSRDELARLKFGNEVKRAAWANNMDSLFVDVKEGDRIVGIYKPNQATIFLLNDKPLGTIQDTEFGPAFFGIWFNDQTKDKALRSALLGAASAKGSGQSHVR